MNYIPLLFRNKMNSRSIDEYYATCIDDKRPMSIETYEISLTSLSILTVNALSKRRLVSLTIRARLPSYRARLSLNVYPLLIYIPTKFILHPNKTYTYMSHLIALLFVFVLFFSFLLRLIP